MIAVELRIWNRVRIIGELPETVLAELRGAFTHENPNRERMRYAKIQGWWAEPKEYKTFDVEKGVYSFPRGGLDRVRRILLANRVGFLEKLVKGIGDPELRKRIPDHRMTLYPHQAEVVEAALGLRTCLVKAPTASGKTTMAFAIVARLKLPTLVLVPSASLVRQWGERASVELGIPKDEIGEIRGKSMRICPLTIANVKSIGRDSALLWKIREKFGVFVFDEVHGAAAPTAFSAVDPMTALYRIGFSDDHRRKDGKEFLIKDLFGDDAIEVNQRELEEQKLTVPVRVRVIPTKFRADWYGIAEDKDDDRKIDFTKLIGEMMADGERNALIRKVAMGEVGRGEQVLVLAHQREHARSVERDLISGGVATGLMLGTQANAEEFDATVAGLRAGNVQCATATYESAGTGTDLPRLGVLVCATPCAGNRTRFRQSRGRVARGKMAAGAEGKTEGRLYYLWDRHVFGKNQIRNLVSWNGGGPVEVLSGGKWIPASEYLV